GRGVGLHVPGVELGWPAHQEQEDAVHIFRNGSVRLETKEIGKRQTQEGERSGVKEVAPSAAAAESKRGFSVEGDHTSPLRSGTWGICPAALLISVLPDLRSDVH